MRRSSLSSILLCTTASTTHERLGIGEGLFNAAWRARQQRRYTGSFKDYQSVLREICDTMHVKIDEEVIDTSIPSVERQKRCHFYTLSVPS